MQENMLFTGTAQCTLVDKTPITPYYRKPTPLKTLQTNRETMQENMLFAGTAQCTLVDKTPIAPC